MKFFFGSSPSNAIRIAKNDGVAGVMISANALEKRKSDFTVGTWILDSGAFTRVSSGRGHLPVSTYADLIRRWSKCGNLVSAVSQDWMCEPFIVERTGLTVTEHQRRTVKGFRELQAIVYKNDCIPCLEIMPVLQGFRVHEYLQCVDMYGDRLEHGAWAGVGSVCRRNGDPASILEILASIKNKRHDLRLHGFGLKQTCLEIPEIRDLLYSSDSMAYAMPRKFGDRRPEPELAEAYSEKIRAALHDNVQKRVPRTAGAGNGQGRKPKWKSKTKAIRIPEKYASRLVAMARQWEAKDNPS